LRLPERNNFPSALQEQSKIGSGGAFFVALLLILLAIGAAGLQVQTVLSRWRDYGILQAVGFTPRQVLLYYGLQFALVLSSGIAIAAIASVPLSRISATSLIVGAGLAALAAGLASLPVLFWPVWRLPAALLRDAA
jgi:ABC-type antimicrobial peptide transport system permease subunit